MATPAKTSSPASHASSASSRESARAASQRAYAALDPAKFPHSASVARALFPAADDVFEFALALFLDAIEATGKRNLGTPTTSRAASTKRRRSKPTPGDTSTTTGVLMGTVAYLSPEQVQRGVADPRSDVYSAGILLYEMLTGAKPFDGETAIQVAYRHVHDDVPPPSEVVPDLPEAMDALVVRATTRDPDGRPSDAYRFRSEVLEAHRQLASADQLRAEIQAGVPAAERTARDQTVQAAQRALGAAYGLAALTAGLNGWSA